VISPTHSPVSDNTQHSQDTSIPPAGFEPAVSTKELPQTHALGLLSLWDRYIPEIREVISEMQHVDIPVVTLLRFRFADKVLGTCPKMGIRLSAVAMHDNRDILVCIESQDLSILFATGNDWKAGCS